MLESGRVSVNGETEKIARTLLEVDDVIEVTPKAAQRVLPEGLSILYEDIDVIVVFKSNASTPNDAPP